MATSQLEMTRYGIDTWQAQYWPPAADKQRTVGIGHVW